MPAPKAHVAAVAPAPVADLKSGPMTAAPEAFELLAVLDDVIADGAGLQFADDSKAEKPKKYTEENLALFEEVAPTLTSASFEGFKFNAATWSTAKNGLAKAKSLQVLNLSHITLPEGEGLKDVLGPLKSTLTHLDLGAIRLRGKNIQHIIPFLEENTKLQDLVVYGNYISPTLMQRLCNVLRTCPALQGFNIACTPCGPDGVRAYVELLTSNTRLARNVRLNGYWYDKKVREPHDNQVNIFLEMQGNALSSDEKSSLADVKSAAPLRVGSKVKYDKLWVSYFKLTENAAAAIAQLLSENRVEKLSMLHFVRDNKTVLKGIFKTLPISQLKLFTFQFNAKGDYEQSEYFMFAQGLLFNNSLTGLSCNYPKGESDKLIVDFVLLMNRSITNLVLSGGNAEFAAYIMQRSGRLRLATNADAKSDPIPASSEEDDLTAKLLAAEWVLVVMLYAQLNEFSKKTTVYRYEDAIRKELARNPDAKVFNYICQLRTRLAEVVNDKRYGKAFGPTLEVLRQRIAEKLNPLIHNKALELNNYSTYGRFAFWCCATVVTAGGFCGGCDDGCGICNATSTELAQKSRAEHFVPITDCLLSRHVIRQNEELERLRHEALNAQPAAPSMNR